MLSRFQIKLRSVLLLITLACGLVAFRQVFIVNYQRQAAGKTKAQLLGAAVETRLGNPEWLRHALGDDNFQDVVMVHMEGVTLKDDDLLFLRDLHRLERLYLARTKVSNKGLVHLQLAKNLRRMSLWRTKIDDAGLRNLTKLTRLEALDLQHNQEITDEGLMTLASLPKLKWINLNRTHVTREGVDQLQAALPDLEIQMPSPLPRNAEQLAVHNKIRELLVVRPQHEMAILGNNDTGEVVSIYRYGRHISKELVDLFGQLDQCPQINLTRASVQSDAFKAFQEIPGLERVILNDLRISSPQDLLPLADVKGLRVLSLRPLHCPESPDEVIRQIREKLPLCQVQYYHYEEWERKQRKNYRPPFRARPIPAQNIRVLDSTPIEF